MLLLGHGPAPCGPRHVARSNPGPSSPLGRGPTGSQSRGPAQQTGIFSSVIKTAFSMGKRPTGHNDAGHLIKESWCPHSIRRNGFRALNSPIKGSEASSGATPIYTAPLGQAKGSDTHIISVHSLTPSLSSLFPLGYSKLT